MNSIRPGTYTAGRLVYATLRCNSMHPPLRGTCTQGATGHLPSREDHAVVATLRPCIAILEDVADGPSPQRRVLFTFNQQVETECRKPDL